MDLTCTLSPSETRTTIDRRAFIGGSLAAAGALDLAVGNAAIAQENKRVISIVSQQYLTETLKPVVEKASDTTLENLPFVSSTDSLAKLLAPGGTSRYDFLVFTTQFARAPLMGEKAGAEKIQPLDFSLIPNAGKLLPGFVKDDVVERNGKPYMVPIFWGYDSVLYNAAKVAPEEADTWALIFDDKYAGRIAWRDDALGMFLAAGLYLGIADPAAMSDADIKEVARFLTAKKKNVRTMWSKFAEAVNLISSGEVNAMYGLIPMRPALSKQGIKAASSFPKEGLIVWTQSAFIAKDAPNPKVAHRVINALISKDYGEKAMLETQYPSASAEAAAVLSPEQRRSLGVVVFERGVKTYMLKFPARMDNWLEAWNTIKAA
jgi:spermidine/putrescine transport system substrate-binding protein